MLKNIRYFFSNTTSHFLIKKFYKKIEIEADQNPSHSHQNFSIKLDNKYIKSPNSHPLKGY